MVAPLEIVGYMAITSNSEIQLMVMENQSLSCADHCSITQSGMHATRGSMTAITGKYRISSGSSTSINLLS